MAFAARAKTVAAATARSLAPWLATPRHVPSVFVLERNVGMQTPPARLQEEWAIVQCDTRTAYGCGKHGQKVVDGLTIYARLVTSPDLTSALYIQASDDALRGIKAGLGCDCPIQGPRILVDERHHFNASVFVQEAGERFIFFTLFFSLPPNHDELGYYLIYDSVAASLSMIPLLPEECHSNCTPLYVPLGGDGGGYKLLLLSRKLVIATKERLEMREEDPVPATLEQLEMREDPVPATPEQLEMRVPAKPEGLEMCEEDPVPATPEQLEMREDPVPATPEQLEMREEEPVPPTPERLEMRQEDILCVWTRADDEEHPWQMLVRHFPPEQLIPSPFAADTMFLVGGKGFWVDLRQGIVHCNCPPADGVKAVDFGFIPLPPWCPLDLRWMKPKLEDSDLAPITTHRASAYVSGAIRFVYIDRSRPGGGVIVSVWDLDLETKIWKIIKNFRAKDLWKLWSFNKEGLPRMEPRFPVLMADGTLCLLGRNKPKTRGDSTMEDYICNVELSSLKVLWSARLGQYRTPHAPLVLPSHFFGMLNPLDPLKRELKGIFTQN